MRRWLLAGAGLVLAMPAAAQAPPHAGPARGAWHVVAEWHDSLAQAASLAAAVEASLHLGDPQRADRLLQRHSALLTAPDRLELAGRVAQARGEWAVAAHAYVAAAAMRAGRARGMLEARAAAAFEAAGVRDSAAAAYGRARTRLPLVAGWLAVRQAGLVRDRAAAESLLVRAPTEAAPLVLESRARQHLLEGRAADAETLLDAADQAGRAAELALARGDTVQALRYATRAAGSGDTAQVRRAVVLFAEHVAPPSAEAALAAAAAAATLRSTRQAAVWGLLAVQLGDSSSTTLLRVGQWLEGIGRRRDALPLYAAAGIEGIVPHARARLRLGDRSAMATLRAFAADYPDHGAAPTALFLAADATNSDSLMAALARRWPEHRLASRARMELAAGRLAARDSAAAEPWLDAEIAARGEEATRARYLRARVKQARRDTAAAMAELRALAAADTLGYYGVIARGAVGPMPAPAFAPVPARVPDPAVSGLLAQLAVFDSLGFQREAEVVVAALMGRDWEPEALLDAAEGLTAADRPNLAIRLGFRAASRLGMNHPRVLRAVFPWPRRDLIEREAAAHGIDPFLIAGLIRQESWFLATARSRAGAIGYMQLMPPTARDVARRLRIAWSDELLVIADANLHLGVAHFAGLIRRYDDDPIPALAAYNAGGTPTNRWRRRPGGRDPVSFVEQITYPETRTYVRSVVRNHALYRWLYGAGGGPG